MSVLKLWWSSAGSALALLLAAPAAHASDSIYLKTGDVFTGDVRVFTGQMLKIHVNGQEQMYHVNEIQKILFDADHASPPAAPAPAANPVTEAEIRQMTRSPAPAPAQETGLVITDYNAVFQTGIFQIVGEVENRTDKEMRYTKVTVFLYDEAGKDIDSNFSYVLGDDPHLKPRQKKSFRVSFLNPPPNVNRYKIRVETSPF